jgi:4-amino-4-deoxy-L-arabinose transferase-like glycosyltransferase
MNVVLTLLAICGLIVLAPMALAMVLLITAYSIGAVRVWRDGRRLRTDFERIIGEQVKR